MHYKTLGERIGFKVSKVALGTGKFGQMWGYGATPEDVKRIIEGFADAVGKPNTATGCAKRGVRP
jgi:aryl-alcohol dehydrogenase-like predicted oxidoreductase